MYRFDAYSVGIHAVKTGNRFAALQPIAQGLKTMFGATGADVGRGLAMRMDHGTQYTPDDFLNQVKFWGTAPSFAFIAEPQANGVAERFNRTLKEQLFHDRVFMKIEVTPLILAARSLKGQPKYASVSFVESRPVALVLLPLYTIGLGVRSQAEVSCRSMTTGSFVQPGGVATLQPCPDAGRFQDRQ